MYLEAKITENGRKNVFGNEETRKQVPLMFLDVKKLTGSQQWGFWTI